MKVLKSLTVSALATSALLAQTNLCIDDTQNGWHLKGATTNISTTEFQNNSNIEAVWIYNAQSNPTNPWKLYTKDGSTGSFSNFTEISQGQGFWVKCNDGGYVDDGSTNDSDLSPDIVTESTTMQVDFTNDFSNHISFDKSDFDWYDMMSKTSTTLEFLPNEYYENSNGVYSWESEPKRTYTLSGITATKATAKNSDNGEYNLTIGSTEKVTSIDGVSYTDLYLTNLSIEVVNPGSGWSNEWDWTPRYWDGTQDVTVTNNTQMLDMFLIGNNWVSDNYAMLDGTSGDTNGNMVEGVVDTSETNYTKVDRTTKVIGSWEMKTDGLHITLPDETMIMNIVSSNNTESGYAVSVNGYDKVGTIWNEQMLWGADATESLIKNLIEQYNQ